MLFIHMQLKNINNSTFLGQDSREWKWHSSGVFSVKSLYRSLVKGGTGDFLHKEIWGILVPSKVKFFIWLVALDKCLTKINMLRGIAVDRFLMSFM
uniref:Reverse transcriptase zinc-binding domain-containing protein n=1 Tax=Nelumbo nucifera TaxID=4432 RepID=A0A822XLC1_NELNU|nr:TPA_asm: hypothetical protein HUJ06_021078 [Nelumbo nucifera]